MSFYVGVMNRPFGIYVHIPYCIQRCGYCDFATYERTKILPPEGYVERVLEEINQKSRAFDLGTAINPNLVSVYFGGGTPSLVDPNLLERILKQIEKVGFNIIDSTEVTLEINPATLTSEKINSYKSMGFNRFSVGAQTLNDQALKMLGREHSSKDTRETLDLLKNNGVNISVDLLFALPDQTLGEVVSDLKDLLSFDPEHISPYCLTLNKDHKLNVNRPIDETQVDMFSAIDSELRGQNYSRYEISNYSKAGFHSRHNCLYWDDESYWGIGLSAHSYLRPVSWDSSPNSWGQRFWNPSKINDYINLIDENRGKSFESPLQNLPKDNFELLKKNQALTDYCHISLRKESGLQLLSLAEKFGSETAIKVRAILEGLGKKKLIKTSSNREGYSLTQKGILLSNLLFEDLTFLDGL